MQTVSALSDSIIIATLCAICLLSPLSCLLHTLVLALLMTISCVSAVHTLVPALLITAAA